MPSSTAKRVVLYRFDRQPVEAFLNPAEYLKREHVELITAGGGFERLAYRDLKALCFGSEMGVPADLFLRNNRFDRRPKLAGLWVRFTFRDADQLDGMLPHNLNEWPSEGFLITPPKANLSRQRVFIPRSAINGSDLLGVVGVTVSKSAPRRSVKDSSDQQLEIFE